MSDVAGMLSAQVLHHEYKTVTFTNDRAKNKLEHSISVICFFVCLFVTLFVCLFFFSIVQRNISHWAPEHYPTV